MSIRTTVTLDEDVLESARSFSRQHGIAFRQALNELVRRGILFEKEAETAQAAQPFRVEPQHMGFRAGLNYDDVSELIEHLEGPSHQ
jgi:hypothetical protein